MSADAETPQARLKRLHMRSMRRGIKEMDLILTAYAKARLAEMDEASLSLYDALLSENDQEIYSWILAREAPPRRFADLIEDIACLAGAR